MKQNRKWTEPVVADLFRKYAELLEAVDCGGDIEHEMRREKVLTAAFERDSARLCSWRAAAFNKTRAAIREGWHSERME